MLRTISMTDIVLKAKPFDVFMNKRITRNANWQQWQDLRLWIFPNERKSGQKLLAECVLHGSLEHHFTEKCITPVSDLTTLIADMYSISRNSYIILYVLRMMSTNKLLSFWWPLFEVSLAYFELLLTTSLTHDYEKDPSWEGGSGLWCSWCG